MLKQEYPRRRIHGLALALTLTALAPAGTALAIDTGAAEIDAPEIELATSAATIEELRAQVDDLSLAMDSLSADNAALQHAIDELSRERDQLRQSLDRFGDLYDPLESDRQLLFELRKSLPETRPEAEAQLARIRSLALSSDPARLGQLVDRIDDNATAFLDWRFGEYETNQELSAAYIETGANAFDSSMQEFRSEALRSVANRLDGLLTILDRIR
jgi:chromosome segregation ATPase